MKRLKGGKRTEVTKHTKNLTQNSTFTLNNIASFLQHFFEQLIMDPSFWFHRNRSQTAGSSDSYWTHEHRRERMFQPPWYDGNDEKAETLFSVSTLDRPEACGVHSCVRSLQADGRSKHKLKFCGLALSSSFTSVRFIPELIAFLLRFRANALQWQWVLYILFVTTTLASINVVIPFIQSKEDSKLHCRFPEVKCYNLWFYAVWSFESHKVEFVYFSNKK